MTSTVCRALPDWSSMLAAACGGDGLSSVYQPVVDLVRGATVGYEALARFSGFGESDPERWFAAARRQGCDAQLEAAALRTALRRRGDLPAGCFLSVNLAPHLLLRDEIRAVWRAEGDLTGVVVELTEQTPIDSYGALQGDLAALRAVGAVIAVDDAGTGYAGLRHLLQLRPSVIKLGRELIVDLDRDEAKLALIEMLGTFADRMNAGLVAEGIERIGELDALLSVGVPLGQGYLLARPGDAWPELDPNLAFHVRARHRAPVLPRTLRDFVQSTAAATATRRARDAERAREAERAS